MKAQQLGGLPYLPKCRDPRCSEECHQNWAHKQAACLARHLQDLPADLATYTGSFTPRKNAGAEEHRKVKKEFCRLVSRWKNKHGYIVEFYGTIHPSNPGNCHYDFKMYSNAPAKPLKQFLSDAWRTAGGLRCALTPLNGEEIKAATQYQSKVRSRVDREVRYLMVRRSDCGLNLVWQTKAFWRGCSLNQRWKLLVQEWFGDQEDVDADEDQLEDVMRGSSPISKRQSRTKISPESVAKTARKIRENRDLQLSDLDRVYLAAEDPAQEFEDFIHSRLGVQRDALAALSALPQPKPAKPHIPGVDPERDRWLFRGKLPTDPNLAVPISIYSQQWGVDENYMEKVLTSCYATTCVNGSWHIKS